MPTHSRTSYHIGYRLSYLGYDILALHALLNRGTVLSVGRQIGVGKESDIFEAMDAEGNEIVIKIHRLGRTSFRSVRKNRDYMLNRAKASWLYMSRLAAIKEYAFMQALHEHGFPVPLPIDQSRHVVVMSRVDGFPMAQIKAGKMEGAEAVFNDCLAILKRLTQYGLVHCDFNEFNLMVSEVGVVTLIDFPQMVSTAHPNAKDLFDRDMNCLIKFFGMKMHYVPPDESVLQFANIVKEVDTYSAAIADKVNVEEDQALLQYIKDTPVERSDDEGSSGDEDGEDEAAGGGKASGEGRAEEVEPTHAAAAMARDAVELGHVDVEVAAADESGDDDALLTETQFENIHAIVQKYVVLPYSFYFKILICILIFSEKSFGAKVLMAVIAPEIWLKRELNMEKWIGLSGIFKKSDDDE